MAKKLYPICARCTRVVCSPVLKANEEPAAEEEKKEEVTESLDETKGVATNLEETDVKEKAEGYVVENFNGSISMSLESYDSDKFKRLSN